MHLSQKKQASHESARHPSSFETSSRQGFYARCPGRRSANQEQEPGSAAADPASQEPLSLLPVPLPLLLVGALDILLPDSLQLLPSSPSGTQAAATAINKIGRSTTLASCKGGGSWAGGAST